MNDFIQSLSWYHYVLAALFFAWVVFYNQMEYLKKLQKDDPAAYDAFMKEAKNKKPWYMG